MVERMCKGFLLKAVKRMHSRQHVITISIGQGQLTLFDTFKPNYYELLKCVKLTLVHHNFIVFLNTNQSIHDHNFIKI